MDDVNFEQDVYEMTNLLSHYTGLPAMIWVSPRGYVQINDAVVTLAPAPNIVAGDLSLSDQKLVFAWARLNAEALLDFWNDGDAFRLLARLKPISG